MTVVICAASADAAEINALTRFFNTLDDVQFVRVTVADVRPISTDPKNPLGPVLCDMRIDENLNGTQNLVGKRFEVASGDVPHKGELISPILKKGEVAIWMVAWTGDELHEIRPGYFAVCFPARKSDAISFENCEKLAKLLIELQPLRDGTRLEAIKQLTRSKRCEEAELAASLLADFYRDGDPPVWLRELIDGIMKDKGAPPSTIILFDALLCDVDKKWLESEQRAQCLVNAANNIADESTLALFLRQLAWLPARSVRTDQLLFNVCRAVVSNSDLDGEQLKEQRLEALAIAFACAFDRDVGFAFLAALIGDDQYARDVQIRAAELMAGHAGLTPEQHDLLQDAVGRASEPQIKQLLIRADSKFRQPPK